jgi:serine/threonine protein phosphatase PrpC/serine/threonine protein kinase
MASNTNDPNRDSSEEILPTWDVPLAMPVNTPVSGEVPVALPVATPVPPEVAEALPVATPVSAQGQPAEAEAPAAAEPVAAEPVAAEPVAAVPAVPKELACPACGSMNPPEADYCADCGYYFSPADRARMLAESGAPGGESAVAVPAEVKTHEHVLNRYELQKQISSRGQLERWLARDLETQTAVVVLRQPLPKQDSLASAGSASTQTQSQPPDDEEEILPTFDDAVPGFPATQVVTGAAVWPSVGWERRLLTTLESSALPQILHYSCDDTHEYLIEEIPTGTLLWDAWDDPDASARERFGYLVQLAELLHRLHQVNAMIEGLRPELICVTEQGVARLNSLDDLLPLPLPADTPIKGSLYTAPELLAGAADARADLYGFGAMLYALHVGRELNERTDFEKPGTPKPFIPQYPDCHPLFGRLMMKTFRREVEARFPTDEASREDATGFLELIRVLEVLRRTHDNVHLEIAAWTNTGIVRTGNEDAFALMQAVESRQEDIGGAALIILCDGMGGYEAGEVAAAMTIQSLRDSLRNLKPFNVATGGTPFVTDPQGQLHREEGHLAEATNIEEVKAALKQALRDANRAVYTASRAPGSKRRGMGCTAEAVYLDGRNVIVGHVGDSRVYHLHEGRLIQLTRDHTLVNRLVELGQLSPEEAETHPRRNELQLAIGGQPDVEPGVYHGKLTPGDWVIVCSDGLTNHVKDSDLKQMLQSEAVSAEMCARRLVNLTLIEGASDNVTVVAVRVT